MVRFRPEGVAHIKRDSFVLYFLELSLWFQALILCLIDRIFFPLQVCDIVISSFFAISLSDHEKSGTPKYRTAIT